MRGDADRRHRDVCLLARRAAHARPGDAGLERAPTRQAILELELRDGRVLRHHTKAVRGTAANPMSRAEVDTKSFDLMAPVLGRRRARRLIDTLWEVEKLRDVRLLRPLLQA